MIIFKSIRYKNFLSSGNAFTDINFRKSKSTLVVGHNGAGKSTMLDALSFGLFGKPHRKIMKSQLVNSINQRQAVVEVEFSIGKSNFKIATEKSYMSKGGMLSEKGEETEVYKLDTLFLKKMEKFMETTPMFMDLKNQS